MATHEQKTFLATYDWAKDWRDLPWAHAEPTLFLANVCQHRQPGRALDIGCGGGTDSVHLARQGWQVTALDFVPRALEYTRRRAAEAGVTLETVEADITRWEPTATWDLVLDHGLLHNMDPVRHAAYRERVLRALAPEGDFVLLHWHPRVPGQANGRMGPRRVSREDIQAFFAPELQERYFAREEFEDLPDMVGGGMSQAYYWFRRNQAWQRPQELLQQIRATLARNGLDPDEGLKRAVAGELPWDCLARVVGAGRLGLTHTVPVPAEANGILADWCRHAGEDPRMVGALLALFAREQHSGICNAAAPKCTVCDVKFCKRLRYR